MQKVPGTGQLHINNINYTAKDMAGEKLKTGILGLNDQGREALAIAADSEYFDICAVADSDAELAEKAARNHECRHFIDYRQLVIQTDLDVLIVYEPAWASIEYIRAAMNKGCHIIKSAPMAIDFEEAAQLYDIARKNKVKLFVANSELFSDGFLHLAKFIETEGKDSFHLIKAVYNLEGTVNEPQNRWLTDPSLAGGGVLLHNCYSAIRQIVTSFDVPEKVFALTSNNAPDKQQRLAITEDTAVLTIQYNDVLMAQVSTSRVFGPYEQFIRLHAKDKYVTADTNSFAVYTNDGQIINQRSYNTTELDWKTEMLDTFARYILQPNVKASQANNDLNTMAVIQSAYLSAKTAMPEDPAKMLSIIG